MRAMSRVLPILFNTEMVRAILDGRKTVTRRVIKHNVEAVLNSPYHKEHPKVSDKTIIEKLCMPPYQTGDILYVRETWRVGAWDIRNQMIAFDYKDGTCGKFVHINDRELLEKLVSQSREDARKAGCEYNGADFVWEKGKSPCRWRPSIHMPKAAARIWLEVTDVRVERLWEITGTGILAEGVDNGKSNPAMGKRWENMQRIAFENLWDSTIKKSDLDSYGWEANPYAWVIEFERCEMDNFNESED